MQNVQVLLQPTRDRHPGGVRRLPAGRERGGEDLQRLQDLHLRLALAAGTLQQHRQRADVVGAEDDIDPGRTAGDLAAVLLREAPADGDLHARVRALHRAQVAEVAVQPVVRVLPHRAGVEHHDVGRLPVRHADIPRVLQQAGSRSESWTFIWHP